MGCWRTLWHVWLFQLDILPQASCTMQKTSAILNISADSHPILPLPCQSSKAVPSSCKLSLSKNLPPYSPCHCLGSRPYQLSPELLQQPVATSFASNSYVYKPSSKASPVLAFQTQMLNILCFCFMMPHHLLCVAQTHFFLTHLQFSQGWESFSLIHLDLFQLAHCSH